MKNIKIIGIPKIIFIPILIGVIARLLYAILFTDFAVDYYWEYGELTKNILDGNGYSLFYWSRGSLEHLAANTTHPLPSAYMPPLYSIFLIPFMLIKEILLRNILLLISQIVIQVITANYLFRITDKIFSEKVGIVAVWIFCLLPEFIFTTSTWGATTLFHLQIVLLIYFVSIKKFKSTIQQILILSSLFISMIYLRSESLGLVVVFCVYIFIKDSKKTAILIASIVLLSWTPWVIRNYIVFDELILTTTNGGQNFYRGNNEYYPGSWGDRKVDKMRRKLAKRQDFEPRMSEYYLDRAFKTITDKPAGAIYNVGSKFFHLWIFYSRDERANNIFYYVPWLILLICGLIGLYKSTGITQNIVLLYLIYCTIIAMIFFALPRYQIMMKIVLIPYAAHTIFGLIQGFLNRK